MTYPCNFSLKCKLDFALNDKKIPPRKSEKCRYRLLFPTESLLLYSYLCIYASQSRPQTQMLLSPLKITKTLYTPLLEMYRTQPELREKSFSPDHSQTDTKASVWKLCLEYLGLYCHIYKGICASCCVWHIFNARRKPLFTTQTFPFLKS